MNETRPCKPARFGFTLIEILVVIAIISILVGLTTAAVMKFLGRGPEIQNMNDLRQLETAVAAFNQDFSLTGVYYPSRLKLCGNYSSYNMNNQLDFDSAQFLLRMFPRILNTWKTTGIAWDGKNRSGVWTLEGDQCLVFFLGGIPSQAGNVNACLGFSRSPTDPSTPGGSRKGPYFTNFQSNRLVALPHALDAKIAFFSYLDAYQVQPFLYFSSSKTRNGYNAYTMTGQAAANSTPTSDCQATAALQPFPGKGIIWPYHDGANYLNPESFQIISAGANGKFGLGTDMSAPASGRFYWNATSFGSISLDGKDDQSNFTDGILGAGP